MLLFVNKIPSTNANKPLTLSRFALVVSSRLIKFQFQSEVSICQRRDRSPNSVSVKVFLWSERREEYSTLLGAPRRCGKLNCLTVQLRN